MNISTILGNGGSSEAQRAGVGSTTQTGASQNATSASASGGVSSGDQVSLSGVSQLISNGASERSSTIASLTSAVRSGTYNVSSSDIGSSLVSEMLARSSSR